MRINYTAWLATLLVSVLWPALSYATHVRAGEITTRRIPGPTLTYEITLTAYYDELKGAPAAADAKTIVICFGDGTSEEVPRLLPIRRISPGTSVNIYRVIHTYPGPGTYTVSGLIQNRNADTKNIGPGNTENIKFWVSTIIQVNTALGLNNTPVLLNPPVDSARVGQKFCHNPAAFDTDGDSIAYRFNQNPASPLATIPRNADPNAPCRGYFVQYKDPALGLDAGARNEALTGPASISINSQTGDLCWDAPAVAGQYNIAFVVEEWRNGVLIGEITRDMQIFVSDGPNKRPQLKVPADICVEAGTVINQTITATDPDGNPVILTAYGGPFNRSPENVQYIPPIISPDYATFTPSTQQPQPASATFNWRTNCSHIREEAYDVVFKVQDVPNRSQGAPLTSLQSFRIRIIGPRPQNLTAKPTANAAGGRGFQLSWTPYTCGPTGTQIVVYRKEGCTNVPQEKCTTGLAASYGYSEIGRVPATTSAFADTASLKRGTSYSYRIIALYPLPNGGYSVVSDQVCLNLPLLAPVMTNVTVDSTSTNRGVITVRWTRPLGLKPGDLGAPYQYRLFRATGLTGTDFTPVATINTNIQPGVADTVFTDRGLNTVANAYRYRLEFYYTDNGVLTRLDVTEAASSVRLAATPAFKQVQLAWQATTPWTNDNQKHRVYRSRSGPNGPFNLVAEVGVAGPATYRYTDTGTDTYLADGNTSRALSADSSYCYRVETVGTYTDPNIKVGLLYNFSQILCATPIDTTRPCPPALTVDVLDCATLSDAAFCNQTSLTNTLKWSNPAKDNKGNDCDTRIASYTIYYSRYEDDQTSNKLTSVAAPTLTFQHQNLTTVAGCYYVTSVNSKGLESQPSNRVCKDNCPLYKLPNVFTPNGDGKNDVFQPMACPRGAESVQFVVYNRWGVKVFETNDLNINWNGTATGGNELPGGLYYYQAIVRFGGLTRNSPSVTYKGWVELIRDGVSMK